MEDEDYFRFSDDILMSSAEKINFRDTAIGVYSQADTFLDLFADGGIRIGDSSAGAPTNYLNVKPDGEINLEGTARVTKCKQFEGIYLGKGGTAPDEVKLGNYIGYSYDIADDSIITFKLPNDWADGTDLTVACRWYINEAYATANGEVNWQAAWAAVPADKSEAVDAPTHSGNVTSGDQNIPATAKTLDETSIGTISGASLSAGDEIGITFERIALVGGTDPTADPVVTCLGVAYTADKLGTAT
jgi:hypothetical protein